eukprot:scaffold13058_cov105-Isochrysis_galbana.AAC.1
MHQRKRSKQSQVHGGRSQAARALRAGAGAAVAVCGGRRASGGDWLAGARHAPTTKRGARPQAVGSHPLIYPAAATPHSNEDQQAIRSVSTSDSD